MSHEFGVPMGYVCSAEVMGMPYETMQRILNLRNGEISGF